MALPMTNNQDAIAWTDLHLSPVALDLGFFQLRWYSLAYLAGIFVGYWYLLKLIKQPGSPMARRHADDMVFYAAESSSAAGSAMCCSTTSAGTSSTRSTS